MHTSKRGLVIIAICCTIIVAAYFYYKKQHTATLSKPPLRTDTSVEKTATTTLDTSVATTTEPIQ